MMLPLTNNQCLPKQSGTHRLPLSLLLVFRPFVPHLWPEGSDLTEPLLTCCCAASVQHPSASCNDDVLSFVSAGGSLILGSDMLL